MASTPAQAQSQGGGDATEGVVERMRAAEIEARAQAVSRNVRCLECGHQSIEESGANIAVLLRKVIRDELRKGKAEAEIYKTLSEEYGESILYAPKFDWQTAGLYLVPAEGSRPVDHEFRVDESDILAANKSGKSRVRSKSWALHENLVLCEAKKQEYLEDKSKSSLSKIVSANEKWGKIAEFCREHGVDRDAGQCKVKWYNMHGEYKRIVDFKPPTGCESYWTMDPETRRGRGKLPIDYNKELFDRMDEWCGDRPAVRPPVMEDSMAGEGNDAANAETEEGGGCESQSPSRGGHPGVKAGGSTGRKRKRESNSDRVATEMSASMSRLLDFFSATQVQHQSAEERHQQQLALQEATERRQEQQGERALKLQADFVEVFSRMASAMADIASAIREGNQKKD